MRLSHLLLFDMSSEAKQSSLDSENQLGEKFFVTYLPSQSNVYQNIFCLKNTHKHTKKAKGTKEEKRKTLFIHSCKFVVIETHTYIIAHDKNMMSDENMINLSSEQKYKNEKIKTFATLPVFPS